MTSAHWDERYSARELVWGAAPNRVVERELAALPAGSVLDLASGEGRNAVWLAARGWSVVALDFSAVATERAQQVAREAGVTLDARCANVLDADPGGPYDLVLIAYLQLPEDERDRVLDTATAALGPRGTLLLVAHDQRNVAEGHGGPSRRALCWSAAEIVARLGAGFDVETAGVEERHVEGAPRPALDTVVRARRRL